MQQAPRLKYLFVINAGSGRDDNDAREEKIKVFLNGEDTDRSVYHLPEQFDLKQIKDHVLKTDAENIIAVGGDGTVTMMAGILNGTGKHLGIIPAGSANGMAKELGISENTDEALAVIKAGNIKPCDLICINDKDICLHLADIGLNAHLIKHFDEGKLRGKLGYGLVIIKTLWQKRKMQVTIDAGEGKIIRSAFMVALANARMYGTGAVINPEGEIDDGMFEVIVVRKLAFFALLKMLFKPGIFNPKHIEIFSCTAANIMTGKPMHFQIDGEYKGKTMNVHAKIMKGAVKLIVP